MQPLKLADDDLNANHTNLSLSGHHSNCTFLISQPLKKHEYTKIKRLLFSCLKTTNPVKFTVGGLKRSCRPVNIRV